MRFPIIKHARAWVLTSFVIMGLCFWVFSAYMRLSIEFTGGLRTVVSAPEISQSTITSIEQALTQKGVTDAVVSAGKKDNFGSLLVQMSFSGDEQIEMVTSTVEELLISTQTISGKEDILELAVIGPSIGEYMKRSAKYAIGFGLILIAIYILFSFSEMRTFVSPALLGGVTVLTLLFDVASAAGGYGILMMFNHAVQVDAVFIIALLTVMGYSINDTIIILDRVRENFFLHEGQLSKGKISRADIFEMSVWQTMRRSIGTSMTTFLVVIIMYVFGTGVLKMFAFTLAFGVLS